MEFIRTHACSGIRVDDVVNVMGVARRTAELHVRRATGRSIAGQLQEVRLRAVCRLLRETNTPICLIGPSCGYNSDNYLKNLFRERFDMSMREYRDGNG